MLKYWSQCISQKKKNTKSLHEYLLVQGRSYNFGRPNGIENRQFLISYSLFVHPISDCFLRPCKVKTLWDGHRIWKHIPLVLTSVKTSGRYFQIFWPSQKSWTLLCWEEAYGLVQGTFWDRYMQLIYLFVHLFISFIAVMSF